MSRLATAATVAVCALAGAGLALLLLGGGDERTYSAHFTNARGLLAGTDVRVGGAIAGRVKAVELAGDGTALVRFTVDAARAAPRTDAAAAIRPVDLLGDNYLSLSPGHAAAPLRRPIPAARTSNAPRLDELLSAFRAPVRDALQALFVEGGLALDARGTDLAAGAVALRPALQAAQTAADELDGQNRALAEAVVSADRAASQLAARDADVGPLLHGLARTVTATAQHSPDLDRSLVGLPAALGTLGRTATRLDATAAAATPLAVDLRDTAPQLTRAVTGLAPLLGGVRSAAADLRPTVGTLTTLLTRGAPTIAALDAGVERIRATAPQTAQLVDALVPAAPQIAQGFLVDFPDQAQEPGTQPGDPFADPRRAYWRGAAVLSCEAFGVPVKPGCLTDVLQSFVPAGAAKGTAKKTPATPARTGTDGGGAATAPASAAPSATPQNPVRRITDPLLDRLLPHGGPAAPVTDPARGAVGGLLDFLLGP